MSKCLISRTSLVFTLALYLLFSSAWGWEKSRLTSADFNDAAGLAIDLAARHGDAKRVLVVFDVDNTLLKTDMTSLDSNQWFEWQYDICVKGKHPEWREYGVVEENEKDPMKKLLDIACFLYGKIGQRAASAKNPDVVQALQTLGFPCVVMTSRGSEARGATAIELEKNRYFFAKTAPELNPGFYPRSYGANTVSYETGIMMTSGTNKGTCLADFIENLKPDHDIKAVVFVDDSITNTERVLAMRNIKDLDIYCIRYSLEDSVVQDFNCNKDGVWEAVKAKWNKLKEEWAGLKKENNRTDFQY